ncbi:MAG: DUF4349 domain-containing protein [Bacillota bacterium]
MGGIVADTSFASTEHGSGRASMVLRVPSDKYALVLGEIEELGTVKYRRTYTNDVTKEYLDLEARITNLTRQEERLREILSQAKNVEEVLRVEKELERVRGEIEAATGRLKYLKDRVSYSTINLSLIALDKHMIAVNTKNLGVFERSVRSFISSINLVIRTGGDLIVFFSGFLPLLVLIIPLGLLGRKFYRLWSDTR